ncbi:hypothetical protein Q8791_08830 [Nocardiopsis sp. CT-R113]|uniref:Lipoprotein n=1 Tax=Nocardiopsis codii TaxID=3065942 RepID=A0ABU7K4Z7_9ACTN|nr:hypothetical protein [Nocardiopsis sp. CT-R113]MEE2037324.1 hypothetical protein [Nocardiopsis sp. CT-R113]
MFRPTTLAAGLFCMALLTACSGQTENAPEQAAPSDAPVTDTSGEETQGQDGLPEGWPPEIPFPVGYEITLDVGAADDGPSTAINDYHGAQVLGVPEEEVQAILGEFEPNGFTTDQETVMSAGGIYRFVNEEWSVSLTVSLMGEDGEFTTEDTGTYSMNYIVGPAE